MSSNSLSNNKLKKKCKKKRESVCEGVGSIPGLRLLAAESIFFRSISLTNNKLAQEAVGVGRKYPGLGLLRRVTACRSQKSNGMSFSEE